MRRLIRAIVEWAYEDRLEATYGEAIEDLQDGDIREDPYGIGKPVVFCRARPGVPGIDPEHIHQYPWSRVDELRYRDNGWQVSNSECIIPAIPYEEVNGDPQEMPGEVADVTTRRPGVE